MKPKSFADWAAAGGHIPKGIDSKEWNKTVKKYVAGGEVEMQAGGAIRAPIKEMIKRIGDRFGGFEAKRLERAADEVPNLESLYEQQSLERLFSGDNAKGIMTMRPQDFEKFSTKLPFDPQARKQFVFDPEMNEKFPVGISQEDYIKYLASLKGFSDIPYLEVNTTPARLKPAPFITGHEGRHRNRAMVLSGQPTGIVQFSPRAELREPMPRRSREEYLQALNEELERTNRMVRPQKVTPKDKPRPLVQLPPVYKDGGEVEAAGGGLLKALKGAQKALPQAERQANLAKLLEPSKVKERLYHGTMASEGGKGQEAIRRLKPSKEGALGSGVYLTPQSEFASTYAGFPARSQLERDIATGSDFAKESAGQLLDRMNRGAIESHEIGGNMLPVYAQLKNPLILEGKGDPMIEALVKLGVDEATAGKMVERAYETKGYIGREVESRARAAGYDGLMQYRDGNLTEVVSYNPNAIKSATGNVGTYDVTSPDLSKAGGGLLRKAIKATKDSSKATSGPAFGAWGFPDDLLRRERGSFASAFGVDYGQTLAPSFEFVPVNKLKTTEKVDEAKVRSLMNAMKESGNTLDNRIPPVIVDSAGNVLDGHHRVEAARRLGYDQVPIIEKFDRQSGPKFGDSYAEGGEVKMQDGGAAFGVFPQMKGKRTKQDPEAAKRVPLDLARGFVAGTLGLPGDLESLARILMNIQGPDRFVMPTSKDEAMAMLGQIFGADRVSMDTKLPTSEEIEAKLPLRGDSPASSLATGIGQLAGGFYTGPASGARAMTAIPKAVVKAGKDFVMAAPQGAPRMFIGPKAKTWDQAKADRAAQMEKEGKDPVDIWRETGTFRSADGILRQEISDVGAVHRNPTQLKELGKQKKEEAAELQQRLVGIPGQKDMFPKALTEAKKPAREKVKTLKEEADELMRHSDVRGQRAKFALEHPELYKAYPELGEIPVYQGGRGIGGERASIRGGPQDMEMEITQSGLRADPRSSALHEMQHAIQTIEGMGPGGNPTFAFANPKAHEILKELRKKASTPMTYDEYFDSFMGRNPSRSRSDVDESAVREGYENYLQSIPKIVKNMDRELQQQAAMEYYRRLAGEAEARATQAREPMSASQRAQEFPYSSYDVLPEDLIVNPAKGSSISMQMGPDDYRRVKAGDTIGDLTVGENISNRGSIEASGIEKVLPGVRAVPMSSFEVTAPHDLFYSKADLDRVRALAEEIRQSGRIDPMIVGVDDKGNYILEGAHRLGALHLLGAKEFPALMAIEEGVKGFAEGGAAFGVFPQMKGRRSKQDPEAAKTFPIDVARGFVSGALGMPGDIESLVRMLPGFDEKTILPTSEDIEKRLPLRSDTPAARAATGLGQIGGGFYTGPLSGARAAVAVPKAVMQAGRDFVQAAGQPAVNVIKPKGGNWMTGSVEKAVQPLRKSTVDQKLADELGIGVENKNQEALNQWIDRNLTNYIKKEMATPEDPVRRLAEEGITHLPDGTPMPRNMSSVWASREEAGFPRSMGTSRQAQVWEALSDKPVGFGTAGEMINVGKGEPWMEKIDPFTRVHGIAPMEQSTMARDLGFDHIVDVLRQDLASGRIRPEQLSKVSMEQAVRRTAEFDQDMAKKMREARIKITEGMPVHKEYPEGYKWIELAPPSYKQENLPPGFKLERWDYKGKPVWSVVDEAGVTHNEAADSAEDALKRFGRSKVGQKALEDALKYEGETMGHCVGGYCDDVLAGKSRIYSLRDAKGEPHVTVEVQPSKTLTPEKRAAQMESLMHRLRGEGMSEEAAIKQAEKLYPESETLSRIVQIKGKQNKAPNEEYLPFVQDFVRSGQWSEIGDFANTGLIKIDPHSDLAKGLTAKGVSVPSYVSSNELTGLLKQAEVGSYVNPSRGETFINPNHPDWADNGMKRGGEVKMQAGGIAQFLKTARTGAKGGPKKLTQADIDDARALGLEIPGVTVADPLAPPTMRMSEALGITGSEGKTLNITEADRSRVFGPNRGGVGFSALQLYSPPHAKANTVWGFGNETVAKKKIRQGDPDKTIWTTYIGSPEQHKSNTVVVKDAINNLQQANKSGIVHPEQIRFINERIRSSKNDKGNPLFPEDFDITDPQALGAATTFERRAIISDALSGIGVRKPMISKEFKEKYPGVKYQDAAQMQQLLLRETDPALMGATTYDVGPHLFTMDKNIIVRPELNEAFPFQVTGTDMGVRYNLAPLRLAAPDWAAINAPEGAPINAWKMSRGRPSQFVSEEYLTNLQKAGYAKGGKVGALSQAKNQRNK